MIECSVNNLTKYYGANKIFENISFELKSGERVGLIGQNGCGKTTLMKVLMGFENHQEGTISFRKNIKVGYLDQIFKLDPGTKVIDVLQWAFQEIWQIKSKMKSLEEELKNLEGNDLEIAMRNYGRLIEEYELEGGYDIEVSVDKVCEGLDIGDSYRGMEFEKLSGGEKTRVMLAKLLLEEPDLLLMDEPTNHLDIESIEWLEEFLQTYKGTVLLISHDRVFLDKVANKIIELTPKKASIYDGNYSYYVEEKERRFLLEYKTYQNQQNKIEQMERQIERYRIWGAMRDSDKMYRRAKEIEKRLDKVDELDQPDFENRKIQLSRDNVGRSGKIVLKVRDLAKAFGDKTLFTDVSFTVFYQDRICIMGDNGSGKTTLLKMFLQEMKIEDSKVSLGASVKVGYLPQNIVFKDEELSILEYFINEHNVTIGEARSELAKVLFIKDDVYKKIKSLSGGEKSRLKLSSLLYEKVNFMILDEPTNHLDIDSREVLEDTLMNYDGTILFVSHDRYFIEKVANKMLILKNKKTKMYPMVYKDYLHEKKKELEKKTIQKQKKTPKKSRKQPIKKKDRSHKIGQLEREIQALEERIKEVDKLMVINSTEAERLNELFIEKEELEEKFEEVFLEWSEIV